jgi:hypothetical protein
VRRLPALADCKAALAVADNYCNSSSLISPRPVPRSSKFFSDPVSTVGGSEVREQFFTKSIFLEPVSPLCQLCQTLSQWHNWCNGSRHTAVVTAEVSDKAANYGPDLAPVPRPWRRASLIAVTAVTVEAPRLYSVAEVCELLQCDSEDWLKDRVRSGQFPARRVCRHLRFSVGDIENIIEACAVARGDDLPVPTSPQRRKNPLVRVTGNVRVS